MDLKMNKSSYADTFFCGRYFGDDLFRTNVVQMLLMPELGDFLEVPRTNPELIQRFGQLYPNLNFVAQVQPLFNALVKDDSVAEILLRKGKLTANDEAKFRYFTLALMNASPDGNEIGEIYGQRAILALEKSDLPACLKDATAAMELNISNRLHKMMTRMQTNVERTITAKESAEKLTSRHQEKLRRKEYYDNVLYRPFGEPNEQIPVAASCVEVKFNSERGRHTITTEDLPAGTTVIVEDPYVGQLQDMFNWDTKRCSYCYKVSNSHIACPRCVFSLYCNEECMNADFSQSHQFECPCAPALHGLRLPGALALSFRAVCKAGPAELYNIFKDNLTKPAPGSRCGFNPFTGVYESDSYYSLCNIANHQDSDDVPPLVCAAIILADVLKMRTEFFSVALPDEETLFMNFVANQIVFHCTSFLVNCFGIRYKLFGKGSIAEIHTKPTPTGTNKKKSAASNKKQVPVVAEDSHEEAVGTAMYSFISLMCHSCAPNCVSIHTSGGKMAIVTSRFVKAQEELTISYGYWYWKQSRSQRRKEIKQRYYFSCECVACAGEWGKIGDPQTVKYLCPGCCHQYSSTEHGRNQRCVVAFKSLRKPAICKNCSTATEFTHFESELQVATRRFSQAVSFIDKGKPIEAIPILAACIKSLQYIVAPSCCLYTCKMSTMLERALSMIANPLE